jgi:hypothetical protein
VINPKLPPKILELYKRGGCLFSPSIVTPGPNSFKSGVNIVLGALGVLDKTKASKSFNSSLVGVGIFARYSE